METYLQNTQQCILIYVQEVPTTIYEKVLMHHEKWLALMRNL